MLSETGTFVASALPTFLTVIWNWTTSPGSATLVGPKAPESPVRTSFRTSRSGLASTVVSVSQRGSSDSAAQLLPGPVTTATFGRTVCPSGKTLSRVTEKVSVAVPPIAIDGIVQLRVFEANEQLFEQSPL